jgi:hypothetical protein
MKRKKFTCPKCNIPSEKSAVNYYKQLKLYDEVLCSDCCRKRNNINISQRMKAKYASINNNTIIKITCTQCGEDREVKYRSRNNKLCIKCAAIKGYHDNRDIYEQLAKNRINNSTFSELVKSGMCKVDKELLSRNGKVGADALWGNLDRRQKELYRRKTDEYSMFMKSFWNRPGYREKMSKIAKEHFIDLWKDDVFRDKMATIRASTVSISKPQKWLYSLLEDLNIEYIHEYKVGPWTFDCYLPKYNRLIEVQGDYWHSLPKAIRSDKAKATYINKYTKFKMLYFYEYEFYGKDVINTRLKYELDINKSNVTHFDFNDVTAKLVNASDINEFMYKYHYIGPINHTINIGFYINDILIACASYGSISRNETAIRLGYKSDEVKELKRFCIHPNYQKKNFASWCIAKSIKWIRNNKKWKCLVAFADSTIGHVGTIYKASNWLYDGNTTESYYYINNGGWVMHKKTLYNRAIKHSMTENVYANTYKFTKMKTSEKYRYIFHIK